ncbi:hypothetical protein [Vibrio nigripulchritudo]|uniref:hypothetical protein n=1 Tax=Vibrio nigripulchritudo TaxID=28173 RepID=UPI0003B1951C|nr:hypothetical protein [Vibrio nigripulchritudo]CCN72616.1 hypothetical protein VIBNISFn118_630006 [Vibrio nigripulchritudo SFn118]
MKKVELQENLETMLGEACERHLKKILPDFSEETILSYTIFCSAGCRSFGVAIATDRNISNTDSDSMFNVSKWTNVNEYFRIFGEVDLLVEKIYNIFYEEDLEDVNLDEMDSEELWSFINGFFIDSVSNVINGLVNKNAFSSIQFSKDVLFGIQFGDPDKYELDMMEKVSFQVNSDKWHSKLKNYINNKELNENKNSVLFG